MQGSGGSPNRHGDGGPSPLPKSCSAARHDIETNVAKIVKLSNLTRNANDHSSDHNGTRIFAGEDHERSKTRSLWLDSNGAYAPGTSPWLGQNPQLSRCAWCDQLGMAWTQRDAHLPGRDKTWEQTQFDYR